MNGVSCEPIEVTGIDFAIEAPAIAQFPSDLPRSGIRENSGAGSRGRPGVPDKPHARGLTQCDADGQSLKPHACGLTPGADAATGEAIPADDWSVTRLGLCAQEQSARIAGDETRVTPAYWLLGKALNAARKHFAKKGRWERWLRARGVGEDRAQKARRLATFFARPADLAGLSLREALRLAKGGTPNPATAKLLRNFDRRMRNAIQAAQHVGKKVERREERAAFSQLIQAALNTLAFLHQGKTS